MVPRGVPQGRWGGGDGPGGGMIRGRSLLLAGRQLKNHNYVCKVMPEMKVYIVVRYNKEQRKHIFSTYVADIVPTLTV